MIHLNLDMKSSFKSYFISVILGLIAGLLFIRPLMSSSHAFDDHADANSKTSLGMLAMFDRNNLEGTIQAAVLGIAVVVFLNFYFRKIGIRSKANKLKNEAN